MKPANNALHLTVGALIKRTAAPPAGERERCAARHAGGLGIWPALASEKGKAGMGGSRACATERRLPSRSRASRAAPPNRACSRPRPKGGVRLIRRSVMPLREGAWPSEMIECPR